MSVGRKPRVAQRQRHGLGGAGAVFVGLGDVAAVGTGAVAQHLGVNAGAACSGVRQLFEHEQPRAFGEHKAIAVEVEGAAGVRRIVVSLAQGPHGGEAARCPSA